MYEMVHDWVFFNDRNINPYWTKRSPIFCWMCALLWKWTFAIYLSLSVSLTEFLISFLRVSSSLNKFAAIFLILLPDIPLSCLEERKLEDVQLLKRRINQLRQGRSGDFQPPGNSKTPLWTGTYTYAQYNVSACFGLLGLLGDPFSKTIAVNPCSWSALVKWICKRLF